MQAGPSQLQQLALWSAKGLCMAAHLNVRAVWSQSAPSLTLSHSRARGVPCMTKTIFCKSCFRCLACMGQAHKCHLKIG